MNALPFLLVIVAFTACGSKTPTQPLESPKTIVTMQDKCPLDILGQWQGVPNYPYFQRLIFHLCEDGTWTNWNGFSGVWALDYNEITIGDETESATGHIFLSGDRLYLNFTGDQYIKLVIIFIGIEVADGLEVEPNTRFQIPFSRVESD